MTNFLKKAGIVRGKGGQAGARQGKLTNVTATKTTGPRISVQMPLFAPTSTWQRPLVSSLPDPAQLTHLAIDCETKDDGLRLNQGPAWPWQGGATLGIGLAWDTGDAYLPIHSFVQDDPDVLGGEERARFERWMTDALRGPALIMHNAQYDVGWLSTNGWAPTGLVEDTLIMAALLNEYRRSYRLNALGKSVLDRTKNETALEDAARAYGLHPKKELYLLPSRFHGVYGAGDARLTYDLAAALRPALMAQKLDRAAETEYRLQRIFHAMRARGIRVDVARAVADREHVKKELGALRKTLGGRNVWGPEIATWLVTQGYTLPKTASGQVSLTKEVLQSRPGDPLFVTILRTRKLEKLLSTYLDGYVLGKQQGGRLYPEFHPLRSDDGGAITGRMSSSAPNFQNLPSVKDDHDDADLGKMVRGYVLPEEGESWTSFDFSQQEPRLALHLALEANIYGAASWEARYQADERTDFYKVLMDLTQRTRKECKIIGLGRLYGMGDVTLCQRLGYPIIEEDGRRFPGEEGRYVITEFDQQVPWMKLLARKVSERGEQRGYLWTIGGRRCRFRDLDGDGSAYTDPKTGYGVSPHKALNRIVQGGSADQLKLAMIAANEAGVGGCLRVPVHDELGASTQTTEQQNAIARAMLGAVTLRIPAAVDAAVGPSWGMAKDL